MCLVGLIHTKSLLKKALSVGLTILPERNLTRSTRTETIFVDDLLKRTKKSGQRQMAILLDEYGGMAGL